VAKRYLVLISRICVVLVGLIALTVFANVCAYVYLRPALPDVDSLRDVQLQVPLRIYTRDGKLIQSIGEQRRIPVRYEQLPEEADPGLPRNRGRPLFPASRRRLAGHPARRGRQP
jgi:membrane carboxypeptidase/penicillin-binding protein